MANRRMFSLDVIDSDAFLDMPSESQCLYFHLSMRADDDGFVNNPKKIQKVIGASDDAVKILLAKKFIISFDSGVIVIKHWRMHNYIQNDRYKETNYKEEKSQLLVDENKAYTQCIQNVSKMETQVRLELELGKVSKEKKEYTSLSDFSLTKETTYERTSSDYKEALKEFIDKKDLGLSHDDFVDGLMAKGYKYKNFAVAYSNWCKRDFNNRKPKQKETQRELIDRVVGGMGYKIEDKQDDVIDVEFDAGDIF